MCWKPCSCCGQGGCCPTLPGLVPGLLGSQQYPLPKALSSTPLGGCLDGSQDTQQRSEQREGRAPPDLPPRRRAAAGKGREGVGEDPGARLPLCRGLQARLAAPPPRPQTRPPCLDWLNYPPQSMNKGLFRCGTFKVLGLLCFLRYQMLSLCEIRHLQGPFKRDRRRPWSPPELPGPAALRWELGVLAGVGAEQCAFSK